MWLQIRTHLNSLFAQSNKASATAASILALGIFTNACLIPDSQAQTPSNEHLQALKEKLTRKSECLPECAEISRLTVHVSGTSVRLSLDVDAAIDTALPLPGGKKSWLPSEARLDGKTAFVSMRPQPWPQSARPMCLPSQDGKAARTVTAVCEPPR